MRLLTRASATSKSYASRRRLTVSGWVGGGLLAVILLVAFVPRLFTRADPQDGDIITRLAPPSAAHALGPVTLGLAAGFYGRGIDTTIMRIVDIFLAFPAILLALALVAVFGAGVGSVIAALILVSWTQYARVVRAATLAEKGRAYVEAARTIGAGDLHIVIRHI